MNSYPSLQSPGNTAFRITRAVVQTVEPSDNTITVVTEAQGDQGGQILSNVRQIVSYVDNDGTGSFYVPKIGTSCLVAIVQSGLHFDAFVLGYFQDFDESGKHGEKNPLIQIGDQGFVASANSHIIIRKTGIVELKASPYCHVVFKPLSNTIYGIFQNLELFRDPLNRWMIHEKNNRVTHEIGVWANLEQVQSANPKEPQVVVRMGHTRHTGGGGGIYEEFNDDSLVKGVVKSLSDDGTSERSRLVFGFGKTEDGSSARLFIEDKDSGNRFSIDIGELVDNKVLHLKVNDSKLQLSIDADGRILVSNESASAEIAGNGDVKVDTQGNVALVSAKAISADGSGAKLKLSGGKVGMGSGSNELVDLAIQDIDAILNAPIIGLSNMGPVTISPALKQALMGVKTKLNAIKGGI